MSQNDLSRVKRNIGKMIDQDAPEADIDAYLQTEGVTAEQLRASGKPKPQAGSAAPRPNFAPAPMGGMPQAPASDNGFPYPEEQAPTTDGFDAPAKSLGLTAEQEQAAFDYFNQSAMDGKPVTAQGLQDFVKQYGAIQFEDPQAVLNYWGQGVRPKVVHVDPNAQAPAEPEINVTGKRPEKINDAYSFGIGGAEGYTFNYADEIGAGIDALLPLNRFSTGTKSIWNGDSFSDAYSQNVKDNRKLLDDIQAEDPLLRLGGNVVGGLLAPTPIKGGGLLKTIKNNRGIINGAIDGGIYGFVSGTGRGEETAVDRLTKGATDAAIGVGLGATIGKVAEVGTKGRRDANFVDDQTRNNPYASYDAEIVEDLKLIVDDTANVKSDPKGRATLTVEEINKLQKSYLVGFERKLKEMDIPTKEKSQMLDALETKSIQQVEAMADTFRGTPAGNALADGIIKGQRLRGLTPEASASGPWQKLKVPFEIVSGAAGATAAGPLGAGTAYGAARYALSRWGNTEAARVNSAERLIKQADRFKKLGEKVGPSGQRETQANFNGIYDEAADAKDAVKASKEEKQADKVMRKEVKKGLYTSEGGPTDVAETVAAKREADRRNSLIREAEKLTAGTAATKKTKGLFDFAEMQGFEKTAPVKAPKTATPTREQAAVDDMVAKGIEGATNTRKTFADLAGKVPEADLVRGLKAIKGDVPEFANEIDRIVLNHRTTKSRGISDVLIPRVKQFLEADGTMARVQAEATKADTIATAKRKLATGGEAAPATPVKNARVKAASAPAQIRGIDREDAYQRGIERSQAQADTAINNYFADADNISDEAYKLVSNAPDIVKNKYRTVEEAKEYIDEVVLPDLEILGVDPSEISIIRGHLLEVAAAKRHKTKADMEAEMKIK